MPWCLWMESSTRFWPSSDSGLVSSCLCKKQTCSAQGCNMRNSRSCTIMYSMGLPPSPIAECGRQQLGAKHWCVKTSKSSCTSTQRAYSNTRHSPIKVITKHVLHALPSPSPHMCTGCTHKSKTESTQPRQLLSRT